MSDKPVAICAVCNHALDSFESKDTYQFIHAGQDAHLDHEPVPITPPSDWRGRCDFCSSDNPEWIVPARDFTEPSTGAPVGAASEGNWSACDECARLIDRNQWSRLVDKVVGDMVAKHPDLDASSARTKAGRLYRQLRANITGPVRKMQ